MSKQYDVTITDKVAPGVPVVSLEVGGRKSLMEKAKPSAVRLTLEDHEAEQLARDGYAVEAIVTAPPKVNAPTKINTTKADSAQKTGDDQKASDVVGDGAAGGAK